MPDETDDGRRCEPLTIMDAASRFALDLRACGSTGQAEAWPVFAQAFDTYGLPERFRSDNGAPFASAGVVALTPLSMRFVKLGIRLERIAPGKPQQNGRHERFHLTMLPLTQAPRADHTAQQAAFDTFRDEYNSERPHEALAMTPPAEHYRPSPRLMPARLPEPDYPAAAAVRRVRHNGEIRWSGELIYVSHTLAGELVAVEETEAGEWSLRFYDHPLGVIDVTHRKVRRRSPVQPPPAGAAADIEGREL